MRSNPIARSMLLIALATGVVAALWAAMYQVAYPYLSARSAVAQFQDAPASNAQLAVFLAAWRGGWVVIAVAAVIAAVVVYRRNRNAVGRSAR